MKGKPLFLVLLILLLSACQSAPSSVSLPPNPPAEIDETLPSSPAPTYVEGLVKELAATLELDGKSQQEIIKVTFDYLVQNIYMADPVGLDVWRYQSREETITYLENRALSPLLFQIGSCEDFAALQVLLLREGGLAAEYVPGYTYSKEGVFVDHAWAVVELPEGWYHLDPQLEHNISLGGQINYQYFMRTDQELVPSHRWGESLMNTFGDLSPAEIEAVQAHYTPPLGDGPPHPTPNFQVFPTPLPHWEEVHKKITVLKEGPPLPPLFLPVEPPILAQNHHITPPLLPNYFPTAQSYDDALKSRPPFVDVG